MAQTKIGERQIGRMLALLEQSGPLSVIEMAARLHMSESSVRRFTNQLIAEKPCRLFVKAWRDNPKQKPIALYCAGAGKDTKYIPVRQRNRSKGWIIEQADARRADALALLAMPQTSSQLAARMGISVTHTTAILRQHREAGLVYIKAWQLPAHKGSQSPVYALGNLPDKPRARRARQIAMYARSRKPAANWSPMVDALIAQPMQLAA